MGKLFDTVSTIRLAKLSNVVFVTKLTTSVVMLLASFLYSDRLLPINKPAIISASRPYLTDTPQRVSAKQMMPTKR